MGPQGGLSALVRRDASKSLLTLFPSCKDRGRRWLSASQEEEPHQKPTLLGLDLGLPASSTVSKLLGLDLGLPASSTVSKLLGLDLGLPASSTVSRLTSVV